MGEEAQILLTSAAAVALILVWLLAQLATWRWVGSRGSPSKPRQARARR
jgi:hypothetical protein